MTGSRAIALVAVVLGMAGCGSGTSQPFIAQSGPAISVPGQTGSTLSLNGAGTASTITVSERGYTGEFTATSSDTAVATVAAGSSGSSTRRNDDSDASATSSGSFTVTAVGGGTATITISDDLGNSSSLTVGVTTTGAVIY